MKFTCRNNFIYKPALLLLCLTFDACISMASHVISAGQSLSRNQTITSPSGQSKTEICPTHSMVTVSHSTVAMLLDNGNFVITDAFNSSVVIWQSFDHPTDTWLPGGKLGHNRLTKEKLSLTPLRNPQNPAPGLFPIWAVSCM
ncbi:unnamed protein product [Prunus armeniaca]|uniref:Bulb-type lectin domain-containing protein n=1 Tax=Prunus armeniaca TaxID=36596 RepID=A0A6J5Y290_PRUAR|nr:unnamed protein product [Prunus armeniaca]CAB4319531.1 unnamed protein product [Prunus armeniaca]